MGLARVKLDNRGCLVCVALSLEFLARHNAVHDAGRGVLSVDSFSCGDHDIYLQPNWGKSLRNAFIAYCREHHGSDVSPQIVGSIDRTASNASFIMAGAAMVLALTTWVRGRHRTRGASGSPG